MQPRPGTPRSRRVRRGRSPGRLGPPCAFRRPEGPRRGSSLRWPGLRACGVAAPARGQPGSPCEAR
eukprot:6679824-Lingulodinium_polyedra.AAC.1